MTTPQEVFAEQERARDQYAAWLAGPSAPFDLGWLEWKHGEVTRDFNDACRRGWYEFAATYYGQCLALSERIREVSV